MNQLDRISFNIAYDSLMDQLIKEGKYKDNSGKEFSIIKRLKQIAEEA
jgi:hypothetical protein